jgi:signal peptidase I
MSRLRHLREHRATRLLGTILSVMLLGTVVAAAAALIVVPKATGSVPLTVLTGSMSPTYDPGSVVVVRPTPTEDLRVGDAITFQERSGDPTVVTHRIVSVVFAGDGTRRFVTQGDANGAADAEPVREIQVRGKVWYSVPYVGHAATALDPGTRDNAVKVVAGGLFLYGAWLFVSGARDHRSGSRRSSSLAPTTSR